VNVNKYQEFKNWHITNEQLINQHRRESKCASADLISIIKAHTHNHERERECKLLSSLEETYILLYYNYGLIILCNMILY